MKEISGVLTAECEEFELLDQKLSENKPLNTLHCVIKMLLIVYNCVDFRKAVDRIFNL